MKKALAVHDKDKGDKVKAAAAASNRKLAELYRKRRKEVRNQLLVGLPWLCCSRVSTSLCASRCLLSYSAHSCSFLGYRPVLTRPHACSPLVSDFPNNHPCVVLCAHCAQLHDRLTAATTLTELLTKSLATEATGGISWEYWVGRCWCVLPVEVVHIYVLIDTLNVTLVSPCDVVLARASPASIFHNLVMPSVHAAVLTLGWRGCVPCSQARHLERCMRPRCSRHSTAFPSCLIWDR